MFFWSVYASPAGISIARTWTRHLRAIGGAVAVKPNKGRVYNLIKIIYFIVFASGRGLSFGFSVIVFYSYPEYDRIPNVDHLNFKQRSGIKEMY